MGLRHDNDLAPRARSLLSQIQHLAARYIPTSLCAKICDIPQVLTESTLFTFGVKEKMVYGSQLEMTVARNFATNFVIELSEPGEDDDVGDSLTLNPNRIQATHICHRLGPSMFSFCALVRSFAALFFTKK